MPYQVTRVEVPAELFMSEEETGLRGFAVFHCYPGNNTSMGRLNFKYTFCEYGTEHDPGAFDIFDLPTLVGDLMTDPKTAIYRAIHTGWFDKCEWPGKEPRWSKARGLK